MQRAILLVLLICAPPALSTLYYISPLGSDANSGLSPSEPWLNSFNANKLSLVGGDGILFLGGVDHFPGGLVITSGGTDPALPVVVSSYGSTAPARLQIDGSKENGITVLNTGGVSISNISVFGTSPLYAAINSGIAVMSTTSAPGPRYSSVVVEDAFSSGFHLGVGIGSSSCRGFSDITITRVTAMNNTGTGILSYGSGDPSCYSHANIVVQASTAARNPGNPNVANSWTGSGIILSGVDGGLITHCLAYENGGSNGHEGGGPVGIWTYDANNVTTTHCVSYGNSNGFPGTSNDGGGFDIDGGSTNCTVEYCLSFFNSGPGFLVCQFDSDILPTHNNTLRYSVSYMDGLSAQNGAAAINFFTPDSTMAETSIYGMSLFSNSTLWPIVAPLNAYTAAFYGTEIATSALVCLGEAGSGSGIGGGSSGSGCGAVVDFNVAGVYETLRLSGNAYWSDTPNSLSFLYNGAAYASLEAFRNGTGQETTSNGQPTGTDQDPQLVTNTTFFQSCVDWLPTYPALPNSPLLDQIRGFAGCS